MDSGKVSGDAVAQAVRLTIEGHPDVVHKWLVSEPKSWGFLAGTAVAACRRILGRRLTEGERRAVWQQLWQALTRLKEY